MIKKEIEELLGKLGIEFEKLAVKREDKTYKVQIDSNQDVSLLIGKYGGVIQSIQRVMEAILFNTCKEHIDILLNVNDYRERQKERLERIAENVAQRVTTEKKEASLRSFSSYERKIIHEFIGENYPDLTSYSEGEGPDRKLIILLKDKSSRQES